jgi:hypothetical protein
VVYYQAPDLTLVYQFKCQYQLSLCLPQRYVSTHSRTSPSAVAGCLQARKRPLEQRTIGVAKLFVLWSSPKPSPERGLATKDLTVASKLLVVVLSSPKASPGAGTSR